MLIAGVMFPNLAGLPCQGLFSQVASRVPETQYGRMATPASGSAAQAESVGRHGPARPPVLAAKREFCANIAVG